MMVGDALQLIDDYYVDPVDEDQLLIAAMDGMTATRKIREREQASGFRVPIIGVTAHALKGDREKCIEAGMDDYISKPISPDALTRKIDEWMKYASPERAQA